jgi:hypothetical protein
VFVADDLATWHGTLQLGHSGSRNQGVSKVHEFERAQRFEMMKPVVRDWRIVKEEPFEVGQRLEMYKARIGEAVVLIEAHHVDGCKRIVAEQSSRPAWAGRL